jgi:hypothetical protein
VASSDNEIVGAVQLEKEWLTGLQNTKEPRAAGLPEIHFIGILLAKAVKPIAVGDTYPNLHCLDFRYSKRRLSDLNVDMADKDYHGQESG